MSIHATPLTSEPVGSRYGYRLEEDSTDAGSTPESRAITLEVWADGYNAEWRTDTGLEVFTALLDRSDTLSKNVYGAHAVAWFGSAEVDPYSIERSYPEIQEVEDFPELCGHLRLDTDQVQIYWEDTTGQNTIEVTAYRNDFSIFEALYEGTVPESERLHTAEAIKYIQTAIEERR